MKCPHGLIHHWVGVIFIPGATLEQTLRIVEDYDHHADYYRPDVMRSKILEHLVSAGYSAGWSQASRASRSPQRSRPPATRLRASLPPSRRGGFAPDPSARTAGSDKSI
jgi:hypothetical protein